MMKDTLIARISTALSMIDRVDSRHTSVDLINLETFNKTGGLYIRRAGSAAYSGNKLIKPICNCRWAELTAAHRPEIQMFEEFQNHVLKSVEELLSTENEGICAQIMTEETMDMIAVYYCSFSHWGHP